MKAIYRTILVAPTTLPSVVQTHQDLWDQTKPILSVVIPCHNYGRYIGETTQSLEAQTFGDFETIIVDSSNEEFTLRVLEDIRNKGVQVLRQKKLNVASALNLGIKAAHGRYVCCMGADDILESTYFEKTLCLLESNPGLDFTYSLVRTFGDENRVWLSGPFDLRLLLEFNYINAAGIFRKSVWEQVGGFDEAMDGYEDWDFWLSAGKAGYRGALIPEKLFKYRRHGSTLNIRSDRKYQKLIDHIRANHHDIYAHPERTKEIQCKYRNIRVPDPFLNLSSKAQYAKSNAAEIVIIGSVDVVGQLTREIMAERIDKSGFIPVATNHVAFQRTSEMHELPTFVYRLVHFLDEYCWLGFVVNVIKTRGARFVVIWNSEDAYDWLPALKTRTSAFTIDVIENNIDSIRRGAKHDNFIDLHIALSDHARRSLTGDFKIASEKVRLLPNAPSIDLIMDALRGLTNYARTFDA